MALTIDKAGSPIKVTGTPDATDEIYPATIRGIIIKHIDWVGPTTAGDGLTLKNKWGRIIVQMTCEADGFGQTKPVFQEVTGIYCDELDSGTLYIYYK